MRVPADTALGAVVAHLQNAESPDFQPANVTWTFFAPLEQTVREKRERRRRMAERALERIDAYAAQVAPGADASEPSAALRGVASAESRR